MSSKTNIKQNILNERIDLLKDNNSINPEIIDRILDYIQKATTEELFYINPIKLSNKINIDIKILLEHLIICSYHKIFKINWEIRCPISNLIVENYDSIYDIATEHYSKFADINFKSYIDKHVLISFSIHQDISDNDFIPENKINVISKNIIKNIDIKANEAFNENIELEQGEYYIIEKKDNKICEILINKEKKQRNQEIKIVYNSEGKYELDKKQATNGKISFTIDNQTDEKKSFMIINKHVILPEIDINSFYITALRLVNTKAFNLFYADENIKSGFMLPIEDTYLMMIDLENTTEMFEKLGIEESYNTVTNYFNFTYNVVNKHKGFPNKKIGDKMIFTFNNSESALEAAIEIRSSFDMVNEDLKLKRNIYPKTTIHHGPCLLVVHNDRFDYFGTTLNILTRLHALIEQGNEIFLSQEVIKEKTIDNVLKTHNITAMERMETSIKGLTGRYNVYILSEKL